MSYPEYVTPPPDGMILCEVSWNQEMYPATWVEPFKAWQFDSPPPPWFDEDWARLPEELGRRAIAAYREFEEVGKLVSDYMYAHEDDHAEGDHAEGERAPS